MPGRARARTPAAHADAAPPPPGEPTRREEALQQVKGRKREVTRTPPDDGAVDDDLGNRTLSALARLRLFVGYFCWLADRQYPANTLPETRVANHRKNSPWLYWICVTLDLVVLACVALIALATTVIAVYKTTLR